MDAKLSWLPIEAKDIEPYRRRANDMLAKVDWRPKQLARPVDPSASLGYRESSLPDEHMQSASLLTLARKLSKDEALLSQDLNHCMQVVRKALQLGMYLSTLYGELSGLDRLREDNRRGGLSEQQQTEFRAMYNSSAAIAMFVTAAFVVHELSSYKIESLGSLNMEFPGIPEVSLQNPVRAMQCMLYYYAGSLDSVLVTQGLEAVKVTLLYFTALTDELKLREHALKHLEAFTRHAYKDINSDFMVHGFELQTSQAEVSVSFNRVRLAEIVGNQDAKHSAKRLVERLLCYDPERQQNPFSELGGFPRLRLGYGKPGTGKSLQIAATATLLHDYCQELGMPFLFWPMPDTIVSTFQGGSAERMVNWMKPLQDPGKIIYAPIDDGENNLEDRGRQGVSAGVREVIGVFLRYTEGAYAVNYGNSAIDIFTNIPDQIDKAVLSRVVDRFAIDGAKRLEDFLDQDYLWWQQYQEIDANFVTMQDPAHYAYLEAQAAIHTFSDIYEHDLKPQEEAIRLLFEDVLQEHRLEEHSFFAKLYRAVQKQFPFFTSRDVRNIQQAVHNRVMDFDLPAAWFDDLEIFFKQPFDRKKDMLIDVMKDNMRGLSFAEIRKQESIRYLDNMVRIASQTKEQQINTMLEDALLREEVQRRLKSRD